MYRKGISALIKNSNNDFLLVNLQSFKEEYYAIPGGGLEESETLNAALIREIFEELGVQIFDKYLIYLGKEKKANTTVYKGLLVNYFCYSKYVNINVLQESLEVSSVNYYEINEIDKDKIASNGYFTLLSYYVKALRILYSSKF